MRSKRFVCVFFLLLLTRMAAAQDSLRVYYLDGQSLEQITDRDVTVTVSLKDTGKVNWLTIYVVNDSNDPINVLPTSITLHQSSQSWMASIGIWMLAGRNSNGPLN
jgi:hypothetical protein